MNALNLGTIVLCAAFATSLQAAAATPAADQHTAVLNIYGPGGPLPAIKDAADRLRLKEQTAPATWNAVRLPPNRQSLTPPEPSQYLRQPRHADSSLSANDFYFFRQG
jgi:hypothetical protein